MIQGIASELLSTYDYKLDAKNRVSIPSEWRPSEGCRLFLLESHREERSMIKVMTHEKFLESINVINERNYTPAQKDKLIGRLHANSLETAINGQGKMLVPKRMVDRGGFSSDVKLVGRGNYFEIWKPELYAEVEQLELAELDELNKELGIF